MKINFCIDKKTNGPHFKVNHPDITETQITEVFQNTFIVFKTDKRIRTIIGHSHDQTFLVVVGYYNKDKTEFSVVTSYKASKKHILFYYKKVHKNE